MKQTSLIAGAHRELYHHEKHLTSFLNIIGAITEVRGSKGIILSGEVKDVKAIWFFGPSRDLKHEELVDLEGFALDGGAVFLFANQLPPLFDAFVKKYGVTLVEPVISPAYITYIDPNHVSVQKGMVNKGLAQFTGDPNSTFAYPNGYTMDLKPPSVPVLVSGQASYPIDRPIVSHAKIGEKGGSLTFCGSPHMFCDEWIKAEKNTQLLQFLAHLSITGHTQLNQIDAEHPELTDRWYTPDTASMSEKLRSCIQESEKLRSNFKDNFEKGLFSMDLSFVAQTQTLAGTLGISNEPLEIVTPQFDTALPPMSAAVYPPQMRDPPGPVLELFDLDDAFASSKTRLAQLAQRAQPRNAEKFTCQAAQILGIFSRLPAEKQNGRAVLEYVFSQIVRWKKQSPEYQQ
jgi:intraflagellar transport protein 52